jgi:hypothetical protein
MIDSSNSLITAGDLPFVFSCFASDIEDFRRGFPKTVPTNMGNKLPFVGHSKKVSPEGDLEYVRYVQSAGCLELVVYND